MTDKVQKIRAFLVGIADADGVSTILAKAIEKKILPYIDSLQEEPASKRFAFKAIPRLLEMIEPTDRAKAYTAKLADALEVEGYSTDAKIVRVSLKIMNGEKVPMATMDSEPVSEQIDFEKELYKAFGQVKDFTLGMRIAKWFYDMGKNSQEPVSDDLRCEYRRFLESRRSTGYTLFEVAEHFANWQKEQFEKNRLSACDKQTEKEAEIESDFVMSIIEKEHRQPTFDDAIKYGMRLQKEQMIKEAVDGQVVKAYTGLFRFSSEEISNDDIKKMNLKFGDKVKLIII